MREDRLLAMASAEIGQLRGADWTARQIAELLRARKIEIRCDASGITLSSDDQTMASTADNLDADVCSSMSTRQRRTPTKHAQEI